MILKTCSKGKPPENSYSYLGRQKQQVIVER